MKKNIIHKVQVEINTTSMAAATAIKTTMDEIIHNQILPAVEALLERYQHLLSADESLQISTLDLDITIQRSQLESSTLLSEIEEQLERKMAEIHREKTVKIPDNSIDYNYLSDIQFPSFKTRSVVAQKKQLEAFFFFLRTGMKPWWVSDSASMHVLLKPDILLETIGNEQAFFSAQFVREIGASIVRKRLVAQFSDEVVIQLIYSVFLGISEHSTPTNALKNTEVLSKLLKEVNPAVRATIWELFLTQLVEASKGTKTADLSSVIAPLLQLIVTSKTTISKPEAAFIWNTTIEPVLHVILLFRNEQKAVLKPIKKAFIEQLKTPDKETPVSKKENGVELQFSEDESLENVDTSSVSVSLLVQDTLQTTDKTQTVDKITSSETTNIETPKASPPEKITVSLPEEGMLFEHAGLVLLSPFLKHFFTHIGLMDDNNQLTDKPMAAHVLHYVATGTEDPWEFDTTFEKYIVGIDFDEPLEKRYAISDTIKTEVKSMLQAVRDNWTAMSSSSDELLQYEYLQRPGKLIVDGQQHRLVMERKTQDILLSQLPWAISIIRFPWSKELLYVEW